MRKRAFIKEAAKKESNSKIELALEVLLDIRELLLKQNEMIRRGKFYGSRNSSKA
ncbi:MAG: hypothetical protein ACXAC5_00310 [Promethearchaeota archaeon]|jgi:hypothetical protein